MPMLKTLQRNINWLFHKLYLKDVEVYGMIRKLSKSSKAEMEVHQEARLQDLLEHSVRHIPYYSNRISEDLKQRILHRKITLNDLGRIPILLKENIRNNNKSLILDNHELRGSYTNTSGGSTGAPITVMQDKQYAVEGSGISSLVKELRTGDPYCNTAVLWGAQRDMYGANDTLIGKIKSWINNVTMFNSAKLEPNTIINFINHINSKKPDMILAYAQSIYQVGIYAKDNNVKVIPQKVIHTGAGQLFPFMRDLIQEVFQTQVFDHYGGREFGAIATECKYGGGLHTLDYNRKVEILDEEGKECPAGVEGEIVVTVLDNYSMPLIRYKVGDRGVWAENENCPCGMTSRKIARITGRTSNNFPLRNGGFVSGEYLTLTFNHISGIVNFQIRQLEFSKIKVFLHVDENYNLDDTELLVINKFIKLFGEEISVDFVYTSEIPITATGKHLFTVSEM